MAPLLRRSGCLWRLPAAASCGMIALLPLVIAGPAAGPLASPPRFSQAFGVSTLAGPYGVATDARVDVWVTDTGHDRVAEFTASSRLLTMFGSGVDQPEGRAPDGRGGVRVAPPARARVAELAAGGVRLGAGGAAGRGPRQLDHQAALAVSPAGTVY